MDDVCHDLASQEEGRIVAIKQMEAALIMIEMVLAVLVAGGVLPPAIKKCTFHLKTYRTEGMISKINDSGVPRTVNNGKMPAANYL